MEMGVGADLTSASKDVANVVDEYIPVSEDDESKPVIGKVFDSLKEAGNFYKMYAHSVGFSVCSSSQTNDKYGVKWKYFLCSKEGFKVVKQIDGLVISENGLQGL
ncbi:hypothetical protein P8452_35169 [Trifolium repens]|nr:hypothetical protein P8452_35169 [Trifolium repens]